MQYVGTITTPEQVAMQLSKSNPLNPLSVEDAEWADFVAYVRVLCEQVSYMIANYTGRVFVPYYAARKYYLSDSFREAFYRNRWYFGDEDALQIDSVTVADTLLTSDQWRAVDENKLPYSGLRLRDGVLYNDFESSLEIVGWWGYHSVPTQLYRTVDSSATINDVSTSLTVTDASLYETLQYLRIEDELMQITARNTTTDVLTVVRGVQGTTASAHTAQPVKVVMPIPSMLFCATRIAAWLYQKRNDTGERVQFADGSSIVPSSLPANIVDELNTMKRTRVYIV